MTPEDFKNDYLSMHGAGFSIAPIFTIRIFRYHNQDPTIKFIFSGAGAVLEQVYLECIILK